MAKTRKKIQELADRMNFEMFVDGSKIRLRAKFEFSDGYRPSTIGLSRYTDPSDTTGFRHFIPDEAAIHDAVITFIEYYEASNS